MKKIKLYAIYGAFIFGVVGTSPVLSSTASSAISEEIDSQSKPSTAALPPLETTRYKDYDFTAEELAAYKSIESSDDSISSLLNNPIFKKLVVLEEQWIVNVFRHFPLFDMLTGKSWLHRAVKEELFTSHLSNKLKAKLDSGKAVTLNKKKTKFTIRKSSLSSYVHIYDERSSHLAEYIDELSFASPKSTIGQIAWFLNINDNFETEISTILRMKKVDYACAKTQEEKEMIFSQIKFFEQQQKIVPVLSNLESTFLKAFETLDSYRVRNLPAHIREFLQSPCINDQE